MRCGRRPWPVGSACGNRRNPRTGVDAICLRSVWGRTAMHFIGVYFLMTGYLPIKFMEFPSIGAVVAKELPPHKGMPSYVLNAMLDHAMGPGVLGSAYAPFRVRSDPNAPDFRVDDLE